jgi:hypothetical protein
MTSEFIKTQWSSYRKSLHPSKRTWIRVINSYEEIPSGFQEVFPEPVTQFPYALLIPEEQLSSFHKKRDAKLVCLYEDRLVILEDIRGKARSTDYPLDTITHLEHGRVLLESWLKISTPSESTTIMFNTVSDQFFTPVIEAIRANGSHLELQQQAEQVRHQQELSKLGYLWKINFKYFNLGRQSIIPGEKIVETVYQPDICLPALNIFKKPVFSKSLTGHLMILTDKELILIRESKKTKTPKENLYGGIFTYIPLHRIQHVSFERNTGKVDRIMNITLADNTRLRAEFFSTTAMNLELFQEACTQQFSYCWHRS